MNYPKINTIFKRDMEAKGKTKPLIIGEYSQPEVAYLKDLKWEATYKVNGTNIHIDIINTPCEGNYNIKMDFCGRTDKAIIPPHLLSKLNQIFDVDTITKYFIKDPGTPVNVSIFGEGYGYKIQDNKEKYLGKEVSFILFDININGIWLERATLEQIAKDLNIDIVPIIGYMTIEEAIEYVKKGFSSPIAIDNSLQAEGLVLKLPNGLLNRRKERIITKIKHVDFK